jgi:hypothetical protein
MVRLRTALRGNQEDTNRFFLAYRGMIPPETFVNPENLGRIVAAAPPGAPPADLPRRCRFAQRTRVRCAPSGCRRCVVPGRGGSTASAPAARRARGWLAGLRPPRRRVGQ